GQLRLQESRDRGKLAPRNSLLSEWLAGAWAAGAVGRERVVYDHRNFTEVSGPLAQCGYGEETRSGLLTFTETAIRGEEEDSVFDDRSGGRRGEFILILLRTPGGKEPASVKNGIAIRVICGAVKMIRAGLDHKVRSALAAVHPRAGGRRLKLELLDRLDRH